MVTEDNGAKVVESGKTITLEPDLFEETIPSGSGFLHWVTDAHQMSGMFFAGRLVELKVPANWNYTIKNISQMGQKYMALIAENGQQVELETTHGIVGQKVKISLPQPKFLRLEP